MFKQGVTAKVCIKTRKISLYKNIDAPECKYFLTVNEI